MKPKLAFILGAIEDGCLTKRESIGDYTIEFDQKNKDWLVNLSKIFKDVFNKTSKIRITSKGFYRLRIHSKRIFNELEELKNNRENNIKNSSMKCKKNFLQGIFDAESSVHKERFTISISNRNVGLLKFCITLLKKFGIETGKICKSNGDVYQFTIYGKSNLVKFKNIIGFSHQEKTKKLIRLLNGSHI